MTHRYFVFPTGLIAGKIYSEKGSGVNTLCLPHDPDPAPSDFPISIHGGYFSNIWGAEYEFNYRHIAEDDDPPCAVCQVQRSTMLMIPAKRNCPIGWVKEYTGMLLGAWEGEYASDYICLDENPEFFEGTRSHDDNGRTLYPVRARCGSLPCPPYVNNHYISCVVCSQ